MFVEVTFFLIGSYEPIYYILKAKIKVSKNSENISLVHPDILSSIIHKFSEKVHLCGHRRKDLKNYVNSHIRALKFVFCLQGTQKMYFSPELMYAHRIFTCTL
jgi:hypothetical protein